VLKGQGHKADEQQRVIVSWYLCAFFVLYFSASFAAADVLSEQLVLEDFLTGHSVEISKGENTPNVPKLPPGDFPVEKDTKSSLKHQIWQARISVPESEEEQRDKNELQQIIEQICSVEFEPQSSLPEPIIVVEPVQTAEPDEVSSDIETLEPEETQAGFKPPYNPVAEQTLRILDNLLQHPDQISNPLELAEYLFYSGHLKEASVFYQEALDRSNPDKADEKAESALDRAWILFQIGNCLRNDEPSKAINTYRKLITEYPNSPWTNLVKARVKLIDWYQKTRPRELIADVHP
jgi:tetratricopeptide (TPR) repeat protein